MLGYAPQFASWVRNSMLTIGSFRVNGIASLRPMGLHFFALVGGFGDVSHRVLIWWLSIC